MDNLTVLEQSTAVLYLVQHIWKVSAMNDTNKAFFEFAMMELVDMTGDDELSEELEFLIDVNFRKEGF